MEEMKTMSVYFEMKGLKDIKQLHQILAGVPLKCLNSKATTQAKETTTEKKKQKKNWIIKASSVVRSPETSEKRSKKQAWLRTAI